VLLAGTASAEVGGVTPNGFDVKEEAAIAAVPNTVYDALTRKVSSWWNPRHTYSQDAKNLALDAFPGGCFCERFPGGGGVQHMTVVYASPGKALRMTGALGPLQGSGLAGSMTWELPSAEGGTKLQVRYVVGGYIPGGFEKIAPLVDGVLAEQLGRLKAFVETGNPTLPTTPAPAAAPAK
jgi:uncharacterized protein YndB with AHSA1/START domain